MPFQFLDQFFKTLEMERTLEKARKPFHVLTLTLLSLLLPLSFLLLARLSYASLILGTPNLTPNQTPFLFSLFFHTNNYPNPVHAAVAALTIASLLHSLTCKITVFSEEPSHDPPDVSDSRKPGLCVAWAVLCVVQVLVGLGIEGSISSGIGQTHFDTQRRSTLSKMIFFLGMHETMIYWCRAVVKPVVDDTIFGQSTAERWPERVVMAAANGGLWWLMMRDEVEALVIVAELKKEMVLGVGMVDFFNWWLYYLVEIIGRVRIVKGCVWMVMVLLWRRGGNPKWGASIASPKNTVVTMV